MEYSYISIEGNIGAGKTTLARLLSEYMKSKLILEEFQDNYFLPLFYENKKIYAFHTEISFLIQRFEQLVSIENDKVIADYFFLKTLIFAKNNLSDQEFILFSKIYQNLKNALRKPDLIIYLKRSSEELLLNINKRGRSFEKDISLTYLDQIDKAYDYYIQNEKLNSRIIILNVEKVDYLNNPNKLQIIFEKLDKFYPIGITEINI